MPVDTQQILDRAKELGDLMAQHPAVAKYKEAQRLVAADPEAGRLLMDFEKELEQLSRQEQAGMPVSEQAQMKLQSMQVQIASHIKIKALNMAQVEFMDLIRKATQTFQRPAVEGAMGGAARGAARP